MPYKDFSQHLSRNLKDSEFCAYFREAQIESAKELLRCGLIKSLTIGLANARTKHSKVIS